MNTRESRNSLEIENSIGKIVHLKDRGRKKLSPQIKFFICIAIVGLAGFLFSPVFSVKTIEVTKMERYTKSQICEKINLAEGANCIFFGSKRAEKLLKEDPYIESVTISRKLPSAITVEIKERKVRGYVPYNMGAYLYIDEYGRVLDVETSFEKRLPLVEGLDFNNFQKGQLLSVSNQESFDVVVKFAQMMTKYNLLDLVVRIDVSDPKDICAYVNHVKVLLGDISDCDQKIRTMAAIIEKIPEKDKGVLDLKNIKGPLIFQYLT